MTKRQNRIIVIARRKPNPAAFALQAEVYCDKMEASPYFPSPVPPIAEVRAAIAALRDAQVAVLSRTRGTAQVRDEALRVLIGLVEAMRALVEKVANENPEVGLSIVEGTTMEAKKERSATKPPFAVYQGRVSGEVHLVARALAKDATYEWAWSGDEGATWTPRKGGKTRQADTTMNGFTPGTSYAFRVRGLTRKGQGDWSEAVVFLVK